MAEELPPPIETRGPCACLYAACYKVGRCLAQFEPEQVATLLAVRKDPRMPL